MRRFRHGRRGTIYELVGRAAMRIDPVIFHGIYQRVDGASAARKLESVSFVVYRSVSDDTLWVRPEREFFDGRFEEIETSGKVDTP